MYGSCPRVRPGSRSGCLPVIRSLAWPIRRGGPAGGPHPRPAAAAWAGIRNARRYRPGCRWSGRRPVGCSHGPRRRQPHRCGWDAHGLLRWQRCQRHSGGCRWPRSYPQTDGRPCVGVRSRLRRANGPNQRRRANRPNQRRRANRPCRRPHRHAACPCRCLRERCPNHRHHADGQCPYLRAKRPYPYLRVKRPYPYLQAKRPRRYLHARWPNQRRHADGQYRRVKRRNRRPHRRVTGWSRGRRARCLLRSRPYWPRGRSMFLADLMRYFLPARAARLWRRQTPARASGPRGGPSIRRPVSRARSRPPPTPTLRALVSAATPPECSNTP